MSIDQTGIVSVKSIQSQIGQPTKQQKKMKLPPFSPLFDGIQKQLRVKDEQTAVNRYVWHNLPDGLTSQYIERMLYYRYKMLFFWLPDSEDETGRFYCLPCAYNGLDVYGMPRKATPVPVGSDDDKKPWIPGLERDIARMMPRELSEKNLETFGILLKDYTPQSQYDSAIPRQALNDQLVKYLSEILPMSRTKLVTQTGIKGFQVMNDSDSSAVYDFGMTKQIAAINGITEIPLQRSIKLDEINANGGGGIDDFLMAYQTLDNYRLSLYGLKQGGVFDKSQYVNQAQTALQASTTDLIYQDGLTIRQEAANFINAYFGPFIFAKTGGLVWCEPSETAVGYDVNGDGLVADVKNQSGQIQAEQGGNVNGNDQNV